MYGVIHKEILRLEDMYIPAIFFLQKGGSCGIQKSEEMSESVKVCNIFVEIANCYCPNDVLFVCQIANLLLSE